MRNRLRFKFSEKFISVFLILSVLMLQGCDFFVAKVKNFEHVVGYMDRMMLAETTLNKELNAFFTLEVRDQAALDYVGYHWGDFQMSYMGLNQLFNELDLTQEQLLLKEKYETEYRPFIDEYMNFIANFFVAFTSEGYSNEALQQDLATYNQYSAEFYFMFSEMVTDWLQSEYHISLIDF